MFGALSKGMYVSLKNILLIAYCFPPAASPESYVTAKIMGALDEVEVDVLSVAPDLFFSASDNSLDAYVEARFGKVLRVFPNLLTQLILSVSRLPLRPDRFILLDRAVCKAARSRMENTHYDAIITRSQYHSAHLVGLDLKLEHPNLPWTASFSDPWVGNSHEVRIPVMSAWSAKMATKVIRHADALIFPTEGIRNFFQSQHPDVDVVSKSSVIPHGFDSDLYTEDQTLPQGPVRMCYFGNFYGPRRVTPIFKALEQLRAAGQIDEHLLRVEFYTQSTALVHLPLKKYPLLQGMVKVHAPLNHLAALSEMKMADVLLLIDAEGQKPSIFLPSKLIDYIGADRLILALTMNGAAWDVAEKAGAVCVDVTNEQEIVQGIKDAMSMCRDCDENGQLNNQTANPEFRESLSVQLLSKEMIKAIEKGVGLCRATG